MPNTKVVFSNILKTNQIDNASIPQIVIVIDARDECFESLNDLKEKFPYQIYTIHADCLKAEEPNYIQSLQNQMVQIQKEAYEKYGLDYKTDLVIHFSLGQTNPTDVLFVESVLGQSAIESGLSPFINGSIYRMSVDNNACPLTTRAIVSKLLSSDD